MTREQKITAYTMMLDGASAQEVADEFGVTVKDIEAAGGKMKAAQAPQHEQLADMCVYPGLAECIRENELTAKAISLLLRGDKTEGGKAASGFLTWLRPRLTGKSDFKTSEWLALSGAYGVSLDTLMKPHIPEDDEI